MKIVALVFATAICSIASAQIEITSNHLPDANDVLIQYPAAFQGEVDLEATGPDFLWDFGGDVLTLVGPAQNTICNDVSDTPLTFQFLFNNPFNPEHNSNFGLGVESFDLAGFITVENAYQYYQNRSDRYAITGFAASLNDIPAGAQGNPVDVIYELPLQYGDSHTSNSALELEVPTLFSYFQEQTRVSEVDGWGTLNILGDTYEVLRVRQELTGNDSAFVELFGNGFNFERPLSVVYEWLSTEFKTPVLRVVTTGGVPSSILVADIPSRVSEVESTSLLVFPNPTTEQLTVNQVTPNSPYSVYNTEGKMVLTGNLNTASINVQSLPIGHYTLHVLDKAQLRTASFMVSK